VPEWPRQYTSRTATVGVFSKESTVNSDIPVSFAAYSAFAGPRDKEFLRTEDIAPRMRIRK